MISLVSIVLLMACVASGNPISLLKGSKDLDDASILQNREVSVNYEPLGCYITKTIVNRKIFKKFTDKSRVPQVCIEIAMKRSYSLFGILQTKLKSGKIQYRCLTGGVENATTTKFKYRCKENIGKRGSIFIYKNVPEPVSADYEPLGCYITKGITKRKIFKKFTDKSWVPQVCIQIATKKRYSLFGILQTKLKSGKIQYRCLTGGVENAKTTFKYRCKENIGKRGSIFIYKNVPKPGIKPPPQFCKFENTSYAEGQEAEWYQSNNDTCTACECSGGKFRDCSTKLYCDTGHKKCSEIYHPPGECCPACKPSCEGRKVGDTWYNRGKLWSEANTDDCSFCRCIPGFQMTCDKVTCIKLRQNCKKAVIPEGKCCAVCEEEEKVTTEPPSFIIILPTTDAPFKLPWER